VYQWDLRIPSFHRLSLLDKNKSHLLLLVFFLFAALTALNAVRNTLKADIESKTVKCKKCNHIANANEYKASDFTKAFLYDSKPSGSSGYKKHAETAYLSCLADCKCADNEMEMIRIRKEEMAIKKAERERDDLERAT
jgi:hypothetical protein